MTVPTHGLRGDGRRIHLAGALTHSVTASNLALGRPVHGARPRLGLMETTDVSRRSFLSSVAATMIAPLVSSDLIRRGFAAALAEHTAPGLDQWEARTERYGCDYLALGAADIQRSLAGDLVLLR